MNLTIAATSCDGSGNSGSCWNEVGARFTVTTLDGEFIGSCTLEGYGDEPYLVACAVSVPNGSTVIVTEDVSTITPGLVPEENPIYFDTADRPVPPNVPSFWGPIFHNGPQSGSASTGTGQTSNVAIWTKENGTAAYDACYVLVDFSDVGCDENGDGKVTFMDVPVGTYTVHQTADLGRNRSVPDFTIEVTGQIAEMSTDGWEPFTATIVTTGSSASGSEIRGAGAPPAPESIDISLITRDPGDGHLLTGACYVLVGFSNEGCDENGDGQVTFDDVPSGTYTIHQTQTPSGYPVINDYDINVEPAEGLPGGNPWDIPLGFVVKQAPEQNVANTRNVSVIIFDTRNNQRVTSGVCVEIAGVSNVGCDEDLIDGQIDFLDIPAGGPYDLHVTNLPAGWEVADFGGARGITVDAGESAPANQFVFIVLGKTPSVAGGSGAETETGAQNAVDSSQETWGATIQVSLCDAPPNSGMEMNCQPGPGVVVDISLASGEWVGSCTTGDPIETPWNTMISLCSVKGLPRNTDFVAEQDLSTIPAGYVPYSNSLSLHVENLQPGGGDQATFSFINVRTDAAASESAGTSTVSVIEDFIVGCVPAEACYNATITLSTSDGQSITTFTCPPPPSPVSSWICLVPNVPRGITVVITIDNVAPGYVVEQNPLYWDTSIEPTAGPVGNRPIFRFDTTDGSTSGSAGPSNESATLLMTFRGCPEEFDPNTGDFFADCTIPLDAPDASIIVWGGDGQGSMSITALDRQENGAYIRHSGQNTMHLQLSGLAPVVRDAYQVFGADGVNGETYTVNLVDGETREVFVFYYFE